MSLLTYLDSNYAMCQNGIVYIRITLKYNSKPTDLSRRSEHITEYINAIKLQNALTNLPFLLTLSPLGL